MPTLTTDYRRAALRVEVDDAPSARLYINHTRRAGQSGPGIPCTLHLASTVQTDYEWHEHIEALVTFGSEATTVTLSANGVAIAAETFPAAGVN